jgi:hypothetical protein
MTGKESGNNRLHRQTGKYVQEADRLRRLPFMMPVLNHGKVDESLQLVLAVRFVGLFCRLVQKPGHMIKKQLIL